MKRIVIILFCLGIVFSSFSAQPSEELDSLLKKLPTVPDRNKCDLFNKISQSYVRSDPEKSYEYANSAYELSLKYSDKQGEALSQLNIGKSLFVRGEAEAALPFIQKSMALSRKNNDESLVAEGYNMLANYYMATGDLPKAHQAFSDGLSVVASPEYEREMMLLKSNLANLYHSTGEYRRAMDLFFEVLSVYEKRNDKVNVATVKNNIALSYHELLNFDKAMEYYEQALSIYKELDMVAAQVVPLNNIGEIHKDRREYSKALEIFRQCYGLSIYLNNEYYKAMGLLGMGETFLLMGSFNEASQHLNEAKSIYERLKNADGLATVTYTLGELAFLQGRTDEAGNFYLQSLKQAQDLNQTELLGKNYQALSNLSVLNGNYKAAYEYYRNFSTISDSVYQESRKNILSEMMAKYDLNKKEGELAVLQKEYSQSELELTRKRVRLQILIVLLLGLFVTLGLVGRLYTIKRNSNKKLQASFAQIADQKEELEQLNVTKDKLLSIIAHDLRGPVGVTKNMLYQMIKDPDVFTPEEQNQIIEELFMVSDKTHDLLENLLSWANNQRGLKINKETVSVKKMIESNVEQHEIFANKKGIRLFSQIAADCNVYCDVNMINLVLRNLITNAIKFTPAKGTITLSGYKEDHLFKIIVQDNGVGMPPDVQARIFDSREFYTSYGTNREKGSGLGLKLCKEFVEKNGGTITVDSDQGRGTTFAFTLEAALPVAASQKSDKEYAPLIEKPEKSVSGSALTVRG